MSTSGRAFFGEERFPNATKHAILGRYVPGALTVLIQRYDTDAIYADLFAGAARYRDGRPGSPLIVAEHAAERFKRGEPRLIRCFNVEADHRTYEQLVKNTSHIPTEVIASREGEWEEHFAELHQLMLGKPAILFLDPFGSRGLEMDKLVQILSGVGTDAWEMILRFDLDGLRRGNISPARDLERAGLKHGYYELPTKVFGTDRWKQFLVNHDLPEENYGALLDFYLEQLLKAGGKPFTRRFVAPIEIPEGLGRRSAYHLIFVTRSEKGLTMISDAVQLAFEEAWREQEKLDAQQTQQLEFQVEGLATRLPPYDERIAAVQGQLRSAVRAFFDKRPSWRIAFRDLHQEMAMQFFGEFREKHLRAVVKGLREEGVLATDRRAIDRETLIGLARTEAQETA